jgi:hypothetical protein
MAKFKKTKESGMSSLFTGCCFIAKLTLAKVGMAWHVQDWLLGQAFKKLYICSEIYTVKGSLGMSSFGYLQLHKNC